MSLGTSVADEDSVADQKEVAPGEARKNARSECASVGHCGGDEGVTFFEEVHLQRFRQERGEDFWRNRKAKK